MTASSLYSGIVLHRRFGPKMHALRYRMFMALLDLDALDELDGTLRLFSRNRFNLFSFHDRDHLDTGAGRQAGPCSLRTQVEASLAEAGIALGGGAITLLALPRILGYAFNPLSVFFCHQADGALVAILYAVRNTFHQRHTYLIPVAPGGTGAIEQSCQKVFYVSPFMDMDMTYAFRIVPPGTDLSVAVDGLKDGTRIIATSFAGTRHPLTDRGILRAFLGHPFLSFAVVGGIHWEALKLWLKGVRLRARPAPPAHPVSIIMRKEI
ncbi:DUF1365 domain-containing protein [Beijerinckia sp. L45]|uniref:DUF1365 domain-containing protein n=1 Tax=Beijerinckia sp. L45 TaxID=1641855 RepID=UPI00131CC24C|nr:DUF1365 family protein [Beijerinckia sp. L45]